MRQTLERVLLSTIIFVSMLIGGFYPNPSADQQKGYQSITEAMVATGVTLLSESGFFIRDAEAKTKKKEPLVFPLVELTMNDIGQTNGVIEVYQGQTAWFQWRAPGARVITAATTTSGDAKLTVSGFSDQCLIEPGKAMIPCRKVPNTVWAQIKTAPDSTQYAVYLRPGDGDEEIRERIIEGGVFTLRHEVTFDTLTDVTIVIDSLSMEGKKQRVKTLKVHVKPLPEGQVKEVIKEVIKEVPVAGKRIFIPSPERVYFQAESIWRQNVVSSASDTGTFNFNQGLIGFKIGSVADTITLAAGLRGGTNWSPLNNGSLFGPGKGLYAFGGVAFILGIPSIGLEITPGINVFAQTNPFKIPNPGYRATLEISEETNILIPARFTTKISTDFTDIKCNTGILTKAAIRLWGDKSWGLYGVGGMLFQGEFTNVKDLMIPISYIIGGEVNTTAIPNTDLTVGAQYDTAAGLLFSAKLKFAGPNFNDERQEE